MHVEPFFFVAEETNNEMTFYKVPNKLRDLLGVFKENQISLKTATLPEFKKDAAKWFKDFPGGLELLAQIKPQITTTPHGFRLGEFNHMMGSN